MRTFDASINSDLASSMANRFCDKERPLFDCMDFKLLKKNAFVIGVDAFVIGADAFVIGADAVDARCDLRVDSLLCVPEPFDMNGLFRAVARGERREAALLVGILDII
jgi:hypothetical protein